MPKKIARLKSVNVKPKKMNGSDSKPTQLALNNATTLHGTNHLAVMKGKRLYLWSVLMLAVAVGTVIFMISIKDRYNSDDIVTKIHSDWPVDKVPFPAISICNFNHVSLNESKTIANVLLQNNISQEKIETFLKELYFLTEFGHGSADVGHHLEIMDTLRRHYYNIVSIMEEVHQKCENLLLYCEFNGKKKNCGEVFSKVPTGNGFCCSFNFGGLNLAEENPMIAEDGDLEYYYDQAVDEEPTRTGLIATAQAGSSSGLRVVFNVEPNDYADWSLTSQYGAKILLSDPHDFIETRLLYKYIAMGESMVMKVEPLIFQSEDGIRHLDPAKRGCWFYDEVELTHTHRYSYETCNTECKIKSFWEFCGCVPYKYPVDNSFRICEFKDLQCLYYMKGHWETTRKQCIPECYKECRDKDYTLINDIMPFLADSYPATVTEGRNVSEMSSVHVHYMKPACNCYKMMLLSDSTTFVANYGGIFSICCGASLVTALEFVYIAMASLIKKIWRT